MNLTQKVLVNTVVQVGGKVVVFVSMLIGLRLTTTYLGVERFGEYAIVLAFTPIMLVLADLGISTLMARELARMPDRRDELAATLLWFRLVASAGVIALAAVAYPFLPYDHEVRVGILIASLGVACLSIGSFSLPFFQVNLRLDLAAMLDVVTAAASLVLIAGAVAFDLGFYALIAATAVAAIGNVILSLVFSLRFWRPNLRLDRSLTRPLLVDAVPMGAVVMLGLLHFKLDAVLLSLLKDPTDVGIYTVAHRFLEYSLVLPALFLAAVFPILSGLLAKHDRQAEEIIERSFNFLLLTAVPLATGLAVLARPVVHLVAPEGFDRAIVPLRVLSAAIVVAFVNTIFASLLLGLNRQRALLAISAAGVVLNVGLNLYFIPRWSYTGAAITTVISECFGFSAVLFLARRSYAFTLATGFLARLAGASLVMVTILVLVARDQLWLGAALAGGSFALAAFALRVVTRTDLRIVFGR